MLQYPGQSSGLFFLSGRSRAGCNIHGIPRHILGETQHPRDTTGRDPSLAVYATAYFARDPVSTGPLGTGFIDRGIPRHVWAGFSNHRAPQNGIHSYRDSTRDSATAGHSSIHVFRRTPEDPIDGTPPHDKYILGTYLSLIHI